MTQKVLVSACLLGHKVRYDNGDVPCLDQRFLNWHEAGRLVHICPEVVGGLQTPRPDAQRQGDRVVTGDGVDVTEPFEKGAQAALKLALEHKATIAILKQDSPSCGSLFIYDGSFTDAKIAGEGTTAELLRKNGIKVFGEDQLDEVERELAIVDGTSS
ncbi:DUF523 domain-containing protein [Cohnella abietis]|uniref:Uncharacterized protein n=1 Tax=Cohnella abietis TaxID=2507935 RepID=A0A3T1D174_9BACL|nr:DUF523 domain-containing protein [Cohnella abietis]BBI31857.1 hypothetical protein KCTCHS21_12560 [Cohnella abietis]